MALPNTHFGAEYISSLADGGSIKMFFAGIGGVSMCSLAYISKLRGHEVSGYDRTPSAATRDLESKGIAVYYENDASHVDGVDMLIYTVAIPEDTPEYRTALERGIPCVSRADYLGYLMSGYGNSIGVSGMHGKSTTTSMLEKIFTVAGKDPTVSCGAVMKDTGSAHRIGADETFIFEACEYMDSFLDFYPDTAIILNIEMDHVDYFHSMEQIEESYAKFAAKTGPEGYAVVNCCDDNVMRAISGYKGHLVTFGMECKTADYSAENISFDHGRGVFDVVHDGETLCHVDLRVFGAHSICDALAAAAASHVSGVSPDNIARGLSSYEGAARRMEYCGKSRSGADIYSDYAHHPTEIATTLTGASEMDYDRIVCVFQPHTYSRTKELFDGFSKALSDNTCSEVVLSKIYSARETDTLGVSSQLLAKNIRKTGKKAVCYEDFIDLAAYLRETTKEGDMVLIMGAGDIPAVIELIK
ncbi:MAG: UDP-N-acetylmuramate--L-alanine ligase [Clostridia bacterium]|nr:UDP-N-acetylmuramate--L-alanine ligase [Clostridia bacterium]